MTEVESKRYRGFYDTRKCTRHDRQGTITRAKSGSALLLRLF